MSDGRERVAYIASQELAKISSLLPSNPNRSLLVHSLANALGLLKDEPTRKRRIQVVKPTRASRQALAAYHSKEYLDYVLTPHGSDDNNDKDTRAELGLEDDSPLFPGLEEYVPLVGGATLTAVETLKTGFAEIAICWDGGRHHAQKSKASGFCYVADAVLAILSLKKPSSSLPHPSSSLPPPSMSFETPTPTPPPEKPISPPHKPRVMYLDLDLHFSDGVSEAFHHSSNNSFHHSNSLKGGAQVLTLSVHHAAPGFFPASPLAGVPKPPPSSSPLSSSFSSKDKEHNEEPGFDPHTLSIPLLPGASAPTYARIWALIARARSIFDPEYVVVQCGADGLAGDPCGVFNWSLGGGVLGGKEIGSEGGLGWVVEQIVEKWPGKKLLLGGGGYDAPNVARAWAYLTSIALGHPLDLDTPIPDHAAFPRYAPSFTLDVPPGCMQDLNDDAYLSRIEEVYERVFEVLEGRMGGGAVAN